MKKRIKGVSDLSYIHTGTIDNKIPLMFVDGSAVYKQFTSKYITHKKGFFILAPSGSGKTYFIERQKQMHWFDGDTLWELTNAHPAGFWWLEGGKTIHEIDVRSDVITMQAKKLGLWLIGASNSDLEPDAIVLPHWSTHKRYITNRQKGVYDGGATIDRLQGVLHHRKLIKQWAKKGVPEFRSVDEAVKYLTEKYNKGLSG